LGCRSSLSKTLMRSRKRSATRHGASGNIASQRRECAATSPAKAVMRPGGRRCARPACRSRAMRESSEAEARGHSAQGKPMPWAGFSSPRHFMPAASSWRRPSWLPRASRHSRESACDLHGARTRASTSTTVPTGTAAAFMMRPTTTPSAKTSKSSSFHTPDGREPARSRPSGRAEKEFSRRTRW